ncbi:MAG: UDP-glucose/GDP-mannose dehydrogenase family protein [Kofleriaceae bacterium]
MQLAIIGTGYVGLVTGAGFADFGNQVACVDREPARIAGLLAGEMPFHEPGLPELVRRNAAAGRLTFTTDTAAAVAGADIVFLAVGTPSRPDGSADLQYVLAAAEEVGRALTGPTVIVTKSTVPVGTADRVREAAGRGARHPFDVASNPEFLKEGDAVNDFMKPARVVLGADTPTAVEALRSLYTGILRTGDRIQVMDVRSAELTKYAANAMLATRISFMNELALLAEEVGADIEHVRRGIGADPRIGNKFLFPGVGFGGSCFPKDLRALGDMGRAAGRPQGVVDAVIAANERQKRLLGERIIAHAGGSLAGKRVAVWGLAFKPETDDIREAPALTLIEAVRAAGATVCAYDPAAMPNVRALLGDDITYAADAYAAAEGADALALVTEWHELRHPDFARLRATMRTPALFDGRNVWVPSEARAAGFHYVGLGRP